METLFGLVFSPIFFSVAVPCHFVVVIVFYPLPLLLKGQIRQQDKLNSLYYLILTWLFPAMCRQSWLKWLWLDRSLFCFYTIFLLAASGCLLFGGCCLFTRLLFRDFACVSFLNLSVLQCTYGEISPDLLLFLMEPLARLQSLSGIIFLGISPFLQIVFKKTDGVVRAVCLLLNGVKLLLLTGCFHASTSFGRPVLVLVVFST